MPDDDLTAELARWKHAADAATPGPWEAHSHLRQYSIWHDELDQPLAREVRDWDDAVFISAARTAIPRLLAALRAVLELAGEWEQAGTDYIARADRAAAASLPGTAARLGARGETFQECAAKLRAAITREITGKGESPG